MTCKNCSKTFDVGEREREFLQRMDLPCPPSHCPPCRRQRRLAFRNERRLYYRQCDESGKKMISLYPQEGKKKITTFDQKVWWDETRWDPLKYGRDFDFNRPFFEQFAELKKGVPRPSLHNTNEENAQYGNHCVGNKDCYLNVGSDLCESCYYTYWAIRCRNCLDVSIAYDCELCYDCVDIRNCFNCYQVDNSEIMIDCQYSYNCKSCEDCFGCVGLRHKRYHFLNKQLSKEEYEYRIKYIQENPQAMDEFLKRYEELKKTAIYSANKNIQSEEVSGDRLFRCRQCSNSFDLEKCDGVDYSSFGFEGVTSQDVDFFGRSEMLYENFSAFGQYNCVSTILCHYSHDVFYSEYCISSHHLLGCISLHHKDYCILNKQYSKEEYEKLSRKIILHMKQTGEWGEFF
ncbi:MAG: hypothetical protein Q8P95_05110, partial [bacterium]|nr:hypothetical protein [bacterium]